MLAAFFTGQGVSIIGQLLVPPFFLSCYPKGLEVYGEWITLSAAVTYFGTLNYGIQTYANNQMTILYNRGEVGAAKSVQASALRVLLLIIGLLGVGSAGVLLMPVGRWLSLTRVSSHAASLTVYLLTLNFLINMMLALLVSSYMAIGRMHRGANWLSFQRLASTLAIVTCVWSQYSFPILALAQLVCVIVFTLLVFIDVRRTVPSLLPSLRYGSWKEAGTILKPSAHFGLLALSGFLIWQAPVLLIQKLLGPASVSVFSLARTVFSMGRQGLAILSFSIGPEITLLTGQRKWPQLMRLYDLSERVVLLMVPIVSVGLLLLSQFLFAVWLHKRNLYDPLLCFMMALISAVMGIKEHKYQFQSSSNEHESLSKFMLGVYAIMLLVSAFLLRSFGIFGFMLMWLTAEIAQTIYILRLNVRLFPPGMKISMAPVLRLIAVLVVAFGIAAWPAFASVQWPLAIVVAVAISVTLLVSLGSYYAFELDDVRSLLLSRIKQRFAPPPIA
jgi:O-antigen/teichoic acid export membrane protein